MEFLHQVGRNRWILFGVLLVGLLAAVYADARTTLWQDYSFIGNTVSGLLLLGITVLGVEQYISHKAQRRWNAVAAFSLEDLGRVARAVFVRHATFIQPPLESIGVVQYKQQLASEEGARQQHEALRELVRQREKRNELYETLHATAERTRQLLIDWAPVMIGRDALARSLSAFSRMHRLIVQALVFLSREQRGVPMGITEEELARKIMEINRLGMELDDRFFSEAQELEPLRPSDARDGQ